MTGDILHAVEIHADPHAVFEAVATQRGQTSFWTADAVLEPRVGSIAEFGFPGTPARLKMLVETLDPDACVAWRCQGDFPFWTGTHVTWQVRPAPASGQTTLLFTHADWPADYPAEEYAHVNFTWGQIVARLKAFVESGQPQPLFTAATPAASA